MVAAWDPYLVDYIVVLVQELQQIQHREMFSNVLRIVRLVGPFWCVMAGCSPRVSMFKFMENYVVVPERRNETFSELLARKRKRRRRMNGVPLVLQNRMELLANRIRGGS